MSKVKIPSFQSTLRNTFYDPTDSTNLYQDYEMTSSRSKKFLIARGFNDIPAEIKKSQSQPKMPYINDPQKSDRSIENVKYHSNFQESLISDRSRIKTSIHMRLEPLESPKDTFRIAHNVTPNKSQTLIDNVFGTPKNEVAHIYKAIDEFRDLKTKSILEQNPSRYKLTSDKFSATAYHFNTMKKDISHIVDKKRTFQNWSSPKLSGVMNYNELKSKKVQDLDNFVEDLRHRDFLSPRVVISLANNDNTDSIHNPNEKPATGQEPRKRKALSRDNSPHRDSDNTFKKEYLESDWLKDSETVIKEYDDYFNKTSILESPYFQAFKKEIPNVFTNAVASRHEVVQIGRWLNGAIDSITFDKKMTQKEKITKADEVYNFVLIELIRQISNDCTERGELFKKIWKAYLGVTQEIINDFKERDRLIENEWKAKLKALEEKNVLLLTEKTEEISELLFKTNEIEVEKAVLRERTRTAVAKEKEALDENSRLKGKIEKLIKVCYASKKEISDWEYKYSKLKKDFDGVPSEESSIDQREWVPPPKFDPEQFFNLDNSFNNHKQDRSPMNFGLPKQVIPERAEKDTSYHDPEYVYVPPIEFDARNTQTDLTLIDKRYDKIFMDMISINNVLREEMIKEKLAREGDYLMNLLEDEQLNEDEIQRLQHHVRAEQLVQKMRGTQSLKEEAIDSSDLIESIKKHEKEKKEPPKIEIKKIPPQKQEGKLKGTVNKILFLLKENKRNVKEQKSGKHHGSTTEDSKQETSSQNPTQDPTQEETHSNQGSPNPVQSPTHGGSQEGHQSPHNEAEPPSKFKVKKSVTIVEDSANDEKVHRRTNSSGNIDVKAKSVKSLAELDDNFNNELGEKNDTRVFGYKKSDSDLSSPTKLNSQRNSNRVTPVPSIQIISEPKDEKVPDPAKLKIPLFGIIHEDEREQDGEHSRPTLPTEPTKKESVNTLQSKSEPTTILMPMSMDLLNPRIEKSMSSDSLELEENKSMNNSRLTRSNVPSLNSVGEATTPRRMSKAQTLKMTDAPKGIIKKDSNYPGSKMKKGKTLIFARSGSNPQDFSTTKGIYSMDNLDTPESRFEAAVKKLNLEPDAAPFGSGGLFPDRTPRNTDKTPRYSETLTGFDRLAVPDKTPRYGDGFTPRHSKKRSKTFVGFPEAQEPAAEEPPTIQEERVIQYIKLYKVEKKNKDELANINKELEIRMIRDQRLIADFQELLETINPDTIDNKKLELMKKQLDKRKTHLEKLNNLRPGLTSDKDFDIDDDDDKIIKMARNTSLDLEVLDAPPEPTIEEIQVETKKDVASNKPIAQISKAISRIAQVNEKKNSPANNIIFKLRHNFQKKLLKMKTVFPIKSVLKQISGIYVERATAVKDTPSIRDMDMASFVYKQFINMYGFQKFAIDKLVKFVVSVRKHSIVPRIFKFAKLVGLMDELQNYSFYEAKQYLLGMEYFNNTTTSGQNYIGADADKSHYIVWSKIFDYTRIFGEKKLTPIELQDFRKDLEKLKQKDPTSKNDRYIVDVDEFLERLIVKYRTLVNRNKDIVRVAFKGGLISHETRMKFIDFYNLFKYMEPEKFEDKKVEDVFINQSDMVEGEDVSLSFEKFVGICYELDICSEQKIKNFIGISNEREVNDRFEELKSRWADEHIRLNEMMLQKKSTVSNEVLTYWRTGLESINNSFVYTESEAEKKYILIRMKIIHLDIFNTF